MAFAPPATRRRLSPRCSHLRTLHSLLLSSPIATHANVLLHDGTKKSHAPLHRRNTAFNARAYNTERPIAQSHAQPPSHTPQRRKKENTLTPNTQEVPRQAHPHTRRYPRYHHHSRLAATRPKIPSHSPDTTPHLLAVPLATQTQKTQHTKHASAHAPHCTATQVKTHHTTRSV